MNIHELDSFRLSDAVKFHSRLNPRIWGRDEHLLPEVREKLLAIAEDFQEFLGVDDLTLKDITISGSNAAYSYTKNSDIDLHLVVDMPPDPVYQELFSAKKYQYNDEHNIRVGGADVELYVQPSDQTHVSQGIYSVKDNEWLSIPRRKRAQIDDACVRDKVADLDARIHAAVKSGDKSRIAALADKIKAMRKAGLDAHGEFGCENVAFKILRNKGCIKLLWDARAAAKDRELSLREAPRKRFRYGFSEGHQGQPYSSEDGVAASTKMYLSETDDEHIVNQFIQHTASELGLDPLPNIKLHTDPEWSEHNHSFGRYDPDTHTLNVSMPNRHILDVLRTVAHELVHCSQHQQHGDIPDDAGETGSEWENDANARAGIIMRDWANTHPEHFEHSSLEENASGYIPKNKREARKPQYAMALSVDVHPGQVGTEANKLALQTGRNGEPGLLMKTANLRESVNDYLWHGSKTEHSVLYPQQANDTGGKEESNKNAVYATPSAKTAIAMGLTTPGSDTGMFPNDPQMVLFKGGIRKGQMVYLHKVPKDLFIKHNSREWYSKPGVEAVKPIEVVAVPVDKWLHLIRQATPADLELQKKYTQKQNVKEYRMPQPSHGPGKYRDLNEPLGPESPPKMPDGTIKVDVSDMYDWYKLGQKISDLDSIQPNELGSGPPSTVFAFGSEDLENMYSHELTRLGLKTHDLDEPGEEDIDEGWRSALAGAAAAGAMAFTPAPTTATAVPAMSPGAQPAASVQQLPMTQAEAALTNAAKAAGMKGAELAQFLAQCAHESADFKQMQELGGAKYLAQYDPTVNPTKARALGNTQAGDGAKYKGRGFIQITGKANYAAAGQALGIDLVNNPEAAARPDVAAKVAVWYWQNKVRPYVQDFSDTRGVTKRINPGLQGLQDRQANFQDYQQQVASAAPQTPVRPAA